jgi:hypothetical protein
VASRATAAGVLLNEGTEKGDRAMDIATQLRLAFLAGLGVIGLLIPC